MTTYNKELDKMNKKRKLIVDLDVVTVAKWDKSKNGDLGRQFVMRIEQGEFEMIVPYMLLDLISEWKHTKLAKEIKGFYEIYSTEIISAINLEAKIVRMNVDRKALTLNLKSYGIKGEDIILVIIACVFDADYLVTFNRKHLKNNEVKINDALRKYGLRTIKIVLPHEI
ncbi:hypothetical protein HYV82_05255 [Candidatus Woesearchaeota archaeon]|nr:hypothetical protein [Candidatus Woesearchaeota archaeon]